MMLIVYSNIKLLCIFTIQTNILSHCRPTILKHVFSLSAAIILLDNFVAIFTSLFKKDVQNFCAVPDIFLRINKQTECIWRFSASHLYRTH